jgi:N-methylhydantoinase B
VPTNSGLFRAISIVAPEGCIANPTFPAPTIARFCGGNIIADTLMRALAPVLPEGVGAGVGNLKVVAYSGFSGGQHWVYMDIQEGSYGGRYGKDGLDAVDTLYANTRNNPIEDIESHFPLRVTQYELLEDRGGPGRWRGGLGTTREIEFLDDAGYSLEGDGSETPPPGLFGGGQGTPGAVLLNRGTDGEIGLPSKFPYRKAAAGHRLCLISPCGGGYGNPLERSREAVREDLIDGYVSRESARTHYGLEGNE